MAAPKLMTVDDYLRTPETVVPSELVYGALRVAESPLPGHQSLVAELFVALRAHVRARNLGRVWIAPLDVILDDDRALVVQPDLFFISRERASIVNERVCGAPDLVIEVLSPEPRIGKTDERIGWFAAYGVRECWLVRQDDRRVDVIGFANRRVAARRTFDRHEPLVSAVLPDLDLAMRDLPA